MAALRPIRASDVDVLVEHRRRAWVDLGIRDGLDACDRAYRRWLARERSARRLVGWIVEDGGRPVASGLVWLQSAWPRPWFPGRTQPYILSMYTEPAHRSRGHATRILDAMVAWCREKEYPRVSLHASEAAEPIYRRAGFVDSSELRLWLKEPDGTMTTHAASERAAKPGVRGSASETPAQAGIRDGARAPARSRAAARNEPDAS